MTKLFFGKVKGIKWVFIFIFFALITILFPQNFDPDDWYIIKKTGSISSITEDDFFIYILASNGIFSIDKSSGDIEYNVGLSNDFNSPQILYYDEYSDYFWLITHNEIYIKSSVSSYWRNLDYSDLGFDFRRTIFDIGSSPSYMWIDVGTGIYPVYAYGSEIPTDEEINFSELDLIKWGSYSRGRSKESLDISQYVIMENWNVGLNSIKKSDGYEINPTVWMEDSGGEIWIGTKEGILLKGWKHSQRLEVIEVGPISKNVTVSHKDDLGNWWFGDSHFKRTGKSYSSRYDGNNILSHWYENENSWDYIQVGSNYNGLYSNIHDITSVGSFLYLSSLGGLIIYDIIENDWEILKQKNGLKDNILWDLEVYNNSLYVGTKFGISEVSLASNIIVPDKGSWIEKFNNIEIYDMVIDSLDFYVSSSRGLYKINHISKDILKVSNKKFNKIQISDNLIWGLNNSLWMIDNDGKESKYENRISDFHIYDKFIWMTNGTEIFLVNLISDQQFEIPIERGNADINIFSLNCDDEWVWLLTDNGIIFYNWVSLFNAEN